MSLCVVVRCFARVTDVIKELRISANKLSTEREQWTHELSVSKISFSHAAINVNILEVCIMRPNGIMLEVAFFFPDIDM